MSTRRAHRRRTFAYLLGAFVAIGAVWLTPWLDAPSPARLVIAFAIAVPGMVSAALWGRELVRWLNTPEEAGVMALFEPALELLRTEGMLINTPSPTRDTLCLYFVPRWHRAFGTERYGYAVVRSRHGETTLVEPALWFTSREEAERLFETLLAGMRWRRELFSTWPKPAGTPAD